MPHIHRMEEEMRAKGMGVYASPEALPALSSMTKDELIAQAEREGVDLSDASNNDERRSAIEAARG